jgi:hypothetical protein
MVYACTLILGVPEGDASDGPSNITVDTLESEKVVMSNGFI